MSASKISLSRLSSQSGSDKHVHGFTDFYEKYIKDLDPQIVCEIGMGGLIPAHWEIYKHIEQDNPGGSSRMWLKYFPNAQIFVMDNFSQVSENDIKRVIDEVAATSDGRYVLFYGDQSLKSDLNKFIEKIGEEIDFLVDDGGHKMQQQQFSFATLFPSIKSKGLYAIEDLHTSEFNPGPKWEVYSDRSNTTLTMLQNYQKTGKIESIYMTSEEAKYLEDNIDFCEILRSNDGKSITSMIGKK
ncbi:MAG: hypothetical protein CMB80_09045 [Flammeovirgaceae bacterium]|nr:hypothetical protein [Flammeovirgaceae bacterium]|tara:strand:- start:614 stop:1339 length:726 start_codon:yes stop_codon:yes gene_type:complete